MSGKKPKFFVRLAPWIGAAIVVMGTTQAGLTWLRGDDLDMRALGTGLLIAGGGTSLISKRASGARFALFLGGALTISATVLTLVSR